MSDAERDARWESLRAEVEALLAGMDDPVAAMANASAAVHAALPQASWTGFYRVVSPDHLRVGPFQGPVACVDIPFGRGVCGDAAESGASIVVPDVHAYPGHIACDAAARSEVVVPVRTPDGRLVAVLDVDSHQPDAFDESDRSGLEAIAAIVGRSFD